MARTISVEPRDPQDPFTTEDLDGRVVDGAEALRQRIVQAIRFRYRTWFLRRNAGLDYDLLIGHRITPSQAASVLNDVVRNEGGDEVTALSNVQYSLDGSVRQFRYAVVVEHIYGDAIPISVVLP